MYVFVVTSIFLFSCTKDDAINDVTRYYDPSQLNEIQENAIGVVEQYTVDNIKNLKAGKICGIIGLSLSALYLVLIVCYFIFVGSMMAGMPWDQIMQQQP